VPRDPGAPSPSPVRISMTTKRKHSKAEIAAMLDQADHLARQGMLQREIAGRLGVSLMTLHRWRKIRLEPSAISGPDEIAGLEEELGSGQRIAELELENSRLRRLVTDLLLEEIKLQEATEDHRLSRAGRSEKLR
jgi:putative transposase